MDFIKKQGKSIDTKWNFTYTKPATCPYCGIGTDGILINRALWNFNGHYLLLITAKCTTCNKTFLFANDVQDTKGHFAVIYPQKKSSFHSDLIQQMSTRFVNIYNQALTAEDNGCIDLASIGYRAALEILIKDYAINELKKPQEEVKKKSLCDAISDYLAEADLIQTADVVRILGNDSAHYNPKYPDLDFSVLKKYMVIFISLIEARLLITHPPVARKQIPQATVHQDSSTE